MEQRNRRRPAPTMPKKRQRRYGKNFLYRLSGSILLIVLAVYVKENRPEALSAIREVLEWSLSPP